MRVRFLNSSADDITWMRRYCRAIFPEGSKNGQKNYAAGLNAIKENPFAGHPSEAIEGAREYHILRTPFTFVYLVRKDGIEVLRVLDRRGEWGGGEN